MSKRIALDLKNFKLDEVLIDSGIYNYKTDISFLDNTIELGVFLPKEEHGDLIKYIEKLNQEINWLQENMNYITSEIKDSYLIELKNDNWLEEGENEVSSEEFINRITLLYISFDVKEGDTIKSYLEYDDGDLFWGHRIHVDIENQKVKDIGI